MSDDAPDLIEPLVGFRAFTLDKDDWLTAVNGQYGIWCPGGMTAHCHGGYRSRLALHRQYQEASYSYPGAYRSMSNPYIDLPTVPPEKHTAPHQDCDCGLYALHTVAQINDMGPYPIVAAIAADGKVCLYETGFRAERAKVVLVASKTLPEAQLQRIARTYQAEVVPMDTLEEAARRYGAIAPPSLTPATPRHESRIPELPSTAWGRVEEERVEEHKPPWIARHGLKLAVACNLSAAAFNLLLGALH